MEIKIKTKWGTATLTENGYYRIASTKEGNFKKMLHRLIATEYFGDWINDPNEPFDIHHIDGDKNNNCVLNLEPMKKSEHLRLHNKGENHPLYGKSHTTKAKSKMSEAKKGKKHSEETKKKISESELKQYAGIVKYGRDNGKQRYAIRFNGKIVKQSYFVNNLLKWFFNNYPLEIIKVVGD